MRIGKYTFHCLFTEEAILPEYKGSTFRGVLGHALKTIVCALRKENCSDCVLQRSCLYITLFDPSCNYRGVPPPPPYVIEPEDNGKTHFKEGEGFSFNLMLFGKANDYLPHFVYAFSEIGGRGIGKRKNETKGRFYLSYVKSDDITVYDGKEGKVSEWPEPKDYPPVFESNDNGIIKLAVRILTPLRVKYANHLAADLPFHLLIRTALRRISVLYKNYGEGEPPLDYRGIVNRAYDIKELEKNLIWYDWRRYSRRQEQGMMMGGLLGSISYTGNLSEFLPYLRFCEQVHLGKQTAFGLGRISLEL